MNSVENQPLGGERQRDDLVRKFAREFDRVAAGAISHCVQHDRARLPLDSAAEVFRLQKSELDQQRAEPTRSDEAFARLVVLLQIQLAAAQKNFTESHVGIGAGSEDDLSLGHIDHIRAPETLEGDDRGFAAAYQRSKKIGNGRLRERSLNAQFFGHSLVPSAQCPVPGAQWC